MLKKYCLLEDVMSERKIFDFVQGDSPLLVSMPHVGTSVPSAMSERMTAQARSFPDTDWHVHQLYGLHIYT